MKTTRIYVLVLKDRLFKDPLMGAGGIRTFLTYERASQVGKQWVKAQYAKRSSIEGRSFEFEIYDTEVNAI